MKRINFNIKDRKTLYTILSLVLVCVFTLTVAYSALSAVLTIQGNARVSAADWDIYLANPKVTNGSATTNVPIIKTSSTLEFETTLNMPGDYYEFVVDVVNAGSIDAMIENVVKTPELTAEQAKFLKYEVSYQNGESITTKQLLAKDTTMPIKVRIEYRKDLVANDLPTGQVVLDLSLTLEYVQSDGSGSSVTNNGQIKLIANGSLDAIGTVVTIGSEQFYTIGTEGDNVKLFSMMNITLDDTPCQSSDAGATPFAGTSQYVNNYKTTIEKFGILIEEARLITYDELMDENTFACIGNSTCLDKYPFIYSTSYWTGSLHTKEGYMWRVDNSGEGSIYDWFNGSFSFGVRPVIVISKNDIMMPSTIEFTLDNVTYRAYEGMTWLEWVNSDFNTGNYEIVDETGTSCGALIITDEDYSDRNYNDSIESNGIFYSNTLPC